MTKATLGHFGIEHDRSFMFIDGSNGTFISQRKYPRLALIEPQITSENLELRVQGKEPLSVPLIGRGEEARDVRVFMSNMIGYDVGNPASEWITSFLSSDSPVEEDSDYEARPSKVAEIRMVRLNKDDWNRRAHPRIPVGFVPFADESPLSIASLSSFEDVNTRIIGPRTKGKQIPIERFRANIIVKDTEAWSEDEWLVIRLGHIPLFVINPIARCSVPGIDQKTGDRDTWGRPGPQEMLSKYHSMTTAPRDGFFAMGAMALQEGEIAIGDSLSVEETTKRPFVRLADV